MSAEVGSNGEATTPPKTADTGRDPLTGRVLPGNKLALGARGNAGWLRSVQESFRGVVTPEAMSEVWRVILRQAREGEPHAQALCVRYSGAPPGPEETVESDKSEMLRQEFRRMQERLYAPEEVREMAERLYDGELGDIKRMYENQVALVAKLVKERNEACDRLNAQPRQELVPGPIASVGVREVELEPPAPRRRPRALPAPEPEAERPLLPARRPQTLEDVLEDPRWRPC